MHLDRRELLAALSAVGASALAPHSAAQTKDPPAESVYRVDDPKLVLSAARAVFTKDTIGTLITVDSSGQPRAQSIFCPPPDESMTFWMATRSGSRKLTQIASHSAATLYFADDEQGCYVSIMGHAQATTDTEMVRAKNPYKGKLLAQYFPDFPRDLVLIEFKPKWLEVLTETLASKPGTWQPQGLAI